MSNDATVYFRSTMLPENVEYVGAEDEDWDEIIDACQALFDEHGDKAAFRVTIENFTEDHTWLFGKCEGTLPALEVLKVMRAAEHWDDKQTVMAAYYARSSSTAEAVIDAVDAGEWIIDYNSDEQQAYTDFGHTYADREWSWDNNLEDYIDFNQLGRDHCDGMIQFSDGDFYVFNEWN